MLQHVIYLYICANITIAQKNAESCISQNQTIKIKIKMKKLSLLAAVAVTAVLFSFKAIAPSTWTVDKYHSKLAFTITHMGVSDVEGSFKLFDATIAAPGEDFSNAVLDFTADASSLNTDNDARDKHVKSDAFLD